MTLTEAREFAELHVKDLEYGEGILIMKKGNKFVVTEDFKTYRNKGFEVYESYYNM